jgi:hypothetical protein
VPRNESVDMGMSLRYAEPRGAFDMQSSVCVGCQSVCACLCVCNSSKFTSVCVCAPETELWLTLQSASTASIESQIQGALAERILGATVPMAFPTKQLETRMKTHRT